MNTWLAGALLLAGLASAGVAADDERKEADGETIVLPGRVVAREGDRPVAGAEIVARIGAIAETIRTDADGRFAVRIPPQRRTDPEARFSLAIRHPAPA
jgi:hypothetical protein